MDYMMDKKDRYDSVYMIEKLNIHDMNDMIEMYYMKEKHTWYVKCEWERWLWHDRDMCMGYVWYEWKEREHEHDMLVMIESHICKEKLHDCIKKKKWINLYHQL